MKKVKKDVIKIEIKLGEEKRDEMRRFNCEPQCSEENLECKAVKFLDGTVHFRSQCTICRNVKYLPKDWAEKTGVDLASPSPSSISAKTQKKAAARERQHEELAGKLRAHNVEWAEINGSHWRIGRIDFWPRRQKFFDPVSNLRGQGIEFLLEHLGSRR